ncbi:MAG: Gmad2 immunoglobulin-like domain-containing protein [Patescibacteria group bacterium]
MFKDHKFALIILAVILASALLLRVAGSKKKAVNQEPRVPQVVEQVPANPVMPASTTPVISAESKPRIVKPQASELILSPYEVSGLAPGSWFFEASLPVKLLDNQGQEIVSVPARALSDWMTSDLVPFTANLNFSTQATSGYMVIKKDNPSGLPENDDELRIPIFFK